MRYTGAEEQDPADAAGQAAYAEALKSDWPPTRDNAEDIGGAAGTAACHAAAAATYGTTEIAAQLGWCSEVGSFVGGVFYDVIDSWFGENTATRENLDRIERVVAARIAELQASTRLCALRRGHGEPGLKCVDYDWEDKSRAMYTCFHNEVIGGPRCGVDVNAGFEISEMRSRYGLPYTNSLNSDEELQNHLRLLAAAESGRGAEIIARHPTTKKSFGTIVVIGVASAIGIGIIQKIVTRGKF